MLRASEDLAVAKSSDEIRRAYRDLVDASLGGHYAGLNVVYYVLRASPECFVDDDDVLLRMARWQFAAKYGEPSGLTQWNAPVDAETAQDTVRKFFLRLNPHWNSDILKRTWCRDEDRIKLR